ncbi:MAG: Hpt domain-containing protein [Helicobacteraceae bacterium]|jgi:two-component system chemotaxis sensor kinase CheA|nr:Hpt domain-containing protein [Helicobacteraceae bacterium]
MGILDQANKNFDYEIVDDFMEHFEVMKDAMQPAILALSDPNQYSMRIDELFRIFHNIKSASAYLRFEGILRLSEFVEGALEEARKSQGPAGDEYIDWLLKVNDQFAIWFVDLVNNRERFSPLSHSDVFDTPHLISHYAAIRDQAAQDNSIFL